MKRCPGCGTYYDRAEQEFCVVDGLPLEGEVSEEEDPFIGTIVDGRYEVLSVLGRGGMGAVYMARQKSVEREIALKVIVGETSADLRNRFMLEARLTSSLKSVHTVTVFDFGVSEDMLYLAMEYLEGRSLKDMLDEVEHLPWRTCLKIVSAIAESLGEAHDKGIIHRDLKPANIHMAQMGHETDFVKVLDFGVAKFLSEDSQSGLTGTGMVVGTPSYMSPEQARAKPLGACSDIYGLGIMLYEMLTGVPPFTGEATVDILLKHVTELPPAISDEELVEPLPAGLRGFVMAMLEKEPGDRPQSAREVRDAIDTLLDGGTLDDVYPDSTEGDAEAGEPGPRSREPAEDDLNAATIMVTSPAHLGLADADHTEVRAALPVRRKRNLGVGLAVAALVVGGIVFATTGGEDAPGAGDKAAAPSPTASMDAPTTKSEPKPSKAEATTALVTVPKAPAPASKAAPAAPAVKAAAPAPAVKAAAPARPNKLTIVSKPPGATVLLPNGLQLQGVTPLTIDASSDAMTFTLQKRGYVNLKHTLDAGRSGEVRLKLEVDKAARKARARARKPKATSPVRRPTKPKPKKKRRPGMIR